MMRCNITTPPDETLRAIARLMRDSIMGRIGNAVTIDCRDDEDAQRLFELLEGVADESGNR